MTLAEFMAEKFAGMPAVGDRMRFGAIELIVRDMQGDAITQVGVELEPEQEDSWRFWFRSLYRRLR
jgi:potassium/hydrogen antiporter